MWYFAWVLGVGFAVLLAVLNAMWGEKRGRTDGLIRIGGPGGRTRRLAWAVLKVQALVNATCARDGRCPPVGCPRRAAAAQGRLNN